MYRTRAFPRETSAGFVTGLSLDEDQVGDVLIKAYCLPVDGDDVVEPGRVRIGDHVKPVVVAGQERRESSQGDAAGAEGEVFSQAPEQLGQDHQLIGQVSQ